MKRKIPSLRVKALRSVGAHACNAETTFATEDGKPSTASRLLRSFHDREIGVSVLCLSTLFNFTTLLTLLACLDSSLPPLSRYPCAGKGSARRVNSNDIDLNHPFCACRDKDGKLVMMYGNPALDCLQSYLDMVVELGRMDDTRLGVNFFREWKYNVLVNSKKPKQNPSRGALSLQNWTLSDRTIRAMVDSGMGENIGVLDLTGVQGLTDDLLETLIPKCPNMVRLSLKNCRRITKRGLECVAKNLKNLTCLDVGGSYNLTSMDVLDAVQKLPNLVELHASGLAWNDATLMKLIELRSTWTGLSIGFSHITAFGLREALPHVSETLTHLSLPFMELAVDNALVGFLGKTLPKLVCLDIRGNSSVSSLTGFFDGRHFNHAVAAQELFVLARYSNVQGSSVEETKRIHPVLASNLTVILDGGGVGGGVKRKSDWL